MRHHKQLLLPGDDIGPEIMAEAELVIDLLQRAGVVRLELEHGLVGA